MLVRLHRLRIIRRDRLEELERVSPVRLAHELGYPWPEDIWKGPEKPEVPFHERLPGRYGQAGVRAFEEGQPGGGKAIERLGTEY